MIGLGKLTALIASVACAAGIVLGAGAAGAADSPTLPTGSTPPPPSPLPTLLPVDVSVDKLCYVNLSASKLAPITVSGTGWQHGAVVSLWIAGRLKGQVTASASGTFRTTIVDNEQGQKGRVKQTIVLATDAAGQRIGSGLFWVTSPQLWIVPFRRRYKSSSAPVTFNFVGFPAGSLYEHHYYVPRHKVLSTRRLGESKGPCIVTKLPDRPIFSSPTRPTPVGKYIRQWDTHKRYAPLTVPRIIGVYTVFPRRGTHRPR